MDRFDWYDEIVDVSVADFFGSWNFGDYEIAGEFNFPSGEPIDPNGPSDPDEPVDPVDPVDPEDPVDPVDPIDPVDPVDPVDPIDPEDPVDPNEPVEPLVNWPYGCEIGLAIETNPNSGFGKNSGLVDITELVTRLADRTGRNTLKLLERYEADYEWLNDYDFIVRYLVGSFVNRYEDLSADSLKSILEFVGVGPIDDEVLE